jgi:uncharacterized protein
VELFLPIADLPVNILLVIMIALAVGFLSTMLGVSGAFLLTPLLIFIGIAPGVAVATTTSTVAASAMVGIFHKRLRVMDIAPASMLLAGGITGSALGVWLFTGLYALGQLNLAVSVSYAVLLAIINVLMIVESVRAVRRGDNSSSTELPGGARRLSRRLRVKDLPSLIVALPFAGIGLAAGFVGTFMGTGGSFVLVPVLIYVLRVPVATVFGTSVVFTLITMTAATVMHAFSNRLVDVALAMLLVVGGVVGAATGARVGGRMRGERLRFLLALIVLCLQLMLVLDLTAAPDDLYVDQPLQ